jgi:hypothetical protein
VESAWHVQGECLYERAIASGLSYEKDTMMKASFGIRALVGAVALAAVLVALGSTGANVRAQPLPPRPPTAVPQPTRAPQSDNDHSTSEARGRITGTVIDLATGAPAPGITVVVGDASVQTDQNGNYDRQGLAPGAYQIHLDLQANQGTPEQAPLQIELTADATVVQHLTFRSQAAAAPVPAAVPAALAQPAALPVTAGAERDLAWLWVVALMLVASGLRLARVSKRG